MRSNVNIIGIDKLNGDIKLTREEGSEKFRMFASVCGILTVGVRAPAKHWRNIDFVKDNVRIVDAEMTDKDALALALDLLGSFTNSELETLGLDQYAILNINKLFKTAVR